MTKIGITGGIGSGKSVIARIFTALGYKVYDCDSAASRLMLCDEGLKTALVRLLGNETYTADGRLNKKWLAQVLFNEPSKRQSINETVHPVVIKDFLDWCERHSSERLLFVESAILVESGLINHVDKSIMVSAPVEERVGRILKRDKMTYDEAMARIGSQLDDAEKSKLCDFIVDNSTQSRVLPQIMRILKSVAADSF